MHAQNKEVPRFIQRELPHCPEELRSLVAQAPTDENLSLLQNVCGVSDDVLRQILVLRDFPAPFPPKETVEKFLGQFKIVVSAEVYDAKVMRNYINLTLEILSFNGGIEEHLPGIKQSIGFGFRTARIKNSWSQQDVSLLLSISVQRISKLEQGKFDKADFDRYRDYGKVFFPRTTNSFFSAVESLKGCNNSELYEQHRSSYKKFDPSMYDEWMREFYSEEE